MDQNFVDPNVSRVVVGILCGLLLVALVAPLTACLTTGTGAPEHTVTIALEDPPVPLIETVTLIGRGEVLQVTVQPTPPPDSNLKYEFVGDQWEASGFQVSALVRTTHQERLVLGPGNATIGLDDTSLGRLLDLVEAYNLQHEGHGITIDDFRHPPPQSNQYSDLLPKN